MRLSILRDAAVSCRDNGVSIGDAMKALATVYGACFNNHGNVDGWVPAKMGKTR